MCLSLQGFIISAFCSIAVFCHFFHLTLILGTLYKTDLFVVFISFHVLQNYLCFSKNLVGDTL